MRSDRIASLAATAVLLAGVGAACAPPSNGHAGNSPAPGPIERSDGAATAGNSVPGGIADAVREPPSVIEGPRSLADLGVLAGDDESGDGTRDRPYLAAIRKSPTHRTR